MRIFISFLLPLFIFVFDCLCQTSSIPASILLPSIDNTFYLKSEANYSSISMPDFAIRNSNLGIDFGYILKNIKLSLQIPILLLDMRGKLSPEGNKPFINLGDISLSSSFEKKYRNYTFLGNMSLALPSATDFSHSSGLITENEIFKAYSNISMRQLKIIPSIGMRNYSDPIINTISVSMLFTIWDSSFLKSSKIAESSEFIAGESLRFFINEQVSIETIVGYYFLSKNEYYLIGLSNYFNCSSSITVGFHVNCFLSSGKAQPSIGIEMLNIFSNQFRKTTETITKD